MVMTQQTRRILSMLSSKSKDTSFDSRILQPEWKSSNLSSMECLGNKGALVFLNSDGILIIHDKQSRNNVGKIEKFCYETSNAHIL